MISAGLASVCGAPMQYHALPHSPCNEFAHARQPVGQALRRTAVVTASARSLPLRNIDSRRETVGEEQPCHLPRNQVGGERGPCPRYRAMDSMLMPVGKRA